MTMSAVLHDRSFTQNLAGLLVAALIGILLLGVPEMTSSSTGIITMNQSEMNLTEGKGWASNLLIGVGLTIAVVGCAAVLVGTGVIVAAAVAGTTIGVSGATTALSAGSFLVMGGGGMATVDAVMNWLDGNR